MSHAEPEDYREAERLSNLSKQRTTTKDKKYRVEYSIVVWGSRSQLEAILNRKAADATGEWYPSSYQIANDPVNCTIFERTVEVKD